MAEISSITRVGPSEPFGLQVSRGQIAWHYPLFKFGNNAVVGDSFQTIANNSVITRFLSSVITLLLAIVWKLYGLKVACIVI